MRLVVIAILATSLAACSGDARNDPVGTSGEPRQDSAGRASTTSHGAAASWDYVALGDSLAAGVGANRGYVDRYAAYLGEDTGVRVRVVNLGVSGQTSSELLDALRDDPSMRRALGRAEVVTVNIGINDLGLAGGMYQEGTCGGEDGERCLRRTVETVKENWEAIVAELASLRPAGETIMRTPGLGYTPRAGEDLQPYVGAVNRHIAATANASGIPYAEVRIRQGGMSPDGVHPNGTGYAAIAERLRELGYRPLDEH